MFVRFSLSLIFSSFFFFINLKVRIIWHGEKRRANFLTEALILTKLGELVLIPLTHFYEFRCQTLYVT